VNAHETVFGLLDYAACLNVEYAPAHIQRAMDGRAQTYRVSPLYLAGHTPSVLPAPVTGEDLDWVLSPAPLRTEAGVMALRAFRHELTFHEGAGIISLLASRSLSDAQAFRLLMLCVDSCRSAPVSSTATKGSGPAQVLQALMPSLSPDLVLRVRPSLPGFWHGSIPASVGALAKVRPAADLKRALCRPDLVIPHSAFRCLGEEYLWRFLPPSSPRPPDALLRSDLYSPAALDRTLSTYGGCGLQDARGYEAMAGFVYAGDDYLDWIVPRLPRQIASEVLAARMQLSLPAAGADVSEVPELSML
jgi:hypothetical protein